MEVTSAPIVDGVPAVPSDTNTITRVPRGIYVGTGGNITVVHLSGGDPVTYTGIPGGALFPIQVRKIMATNTTASNMVLVY